MITETEFDTEVSPLGGEAVIEMDKQSLDAFGVQLADQFSTWEGLRRTKETEWIQSLRQFKKIYDPDTYAKIPEKASKVYPGVTRSKVVSAKAKLNDTCFPDTGRAWGIAPTPNSQLPPDVLTSITKQLIQKKVQEAMELAMQETGVMPTDPSQVKIEKPTAQEIELLIDAEARSRAEAMQQEIDDQLLENKYVPIMKKALDSGLLLGTGVVKGPLVQYQKNKTYVFNGSQWATDSAEEARPYIEFTRVWDFYPDMTVTEWQDAEGAYQRHVMTKHEVRSLGRKKGFDKATINAYLTTQPEGDAGFKDWELKLLQITNQSTASEISKGRKYEVLEYWGYVDGRDLALAGVSIPEENQAGMEFEANVWILGKHVIKATLNNRPRETRPWHVFYFEKDDSSIFGSGLGVITRDSQITVAAAARMTLDNAAKGTGPQIEANTDLLDPLQDLDDIFPWKVWIRSGRGQEANYPAIRLHHMENHIAEFLSIVKQFLEFCDLETAIPTYMLIEPQRMGNETAQAASLRYGTTNITIRDLASNWDYFVGGIIQEMYYWNMEFSPKEEIKGDYKTVAKGLSSLMAKEMRAQLLQGANQSLSESQRAWVKDKEMLEEIWKAHDLPAYILRTEAEYDEYIQAMNDPRVFELKLKQLEAEIKKMEATALGQLARAKKANVEAEDIAAVGLSDTVIPPAPASGERK